MVCYNKLDSSWSQAICNVDRSNHTTLGSVNNYWIGKLVAPGSIFNALWAQYLNTAGSTTSWCISTRISLANNRRSPLGGRFFDEILGNKMLIKIVMVIFIILLLITAAYLWFNRQKIAVATGSQAKLLKLASCCLLIVAIIGVLILFISDKLMNVITLVLACLIILNLGLRLGRKWFGQLWFFC